ncbi:MAG: hypothetical protein QOE70_141 [Chthoniobacter sp.]|jgi:hypothetical protein|nr:hypothetical protein [Chthoniobacter sp.]
MKLISVRCNHCGASLDVGESARFVTCSFCNSQLAVERTESAVFTSKIDAIHARTEQIAGNLGVIQLQNDLEQLDREWLLERENYMVQNKHGVTSEPTGSGSVFGGLVAVVFGGFWTYMAAEHGAPSFFPFFGVVFILVGAAAAVNGYSKACGLEQARTAYQRRRAALERRVNEAKRQ